MWPLETVSLNFIQHNPLRAIQWLCVYLFLFIVALFHYVECTVPHSHHFLEWLYRLCKSHWQCMRDRFVYIVVSIWHCNYFIFILLFLLVWTFITIFICIFLVARGVKHLHMFLCHLSANGEMLSVFFVHFLSRFFKTAESSQFLICYRNKSFGWYEWHIT